MLSFEVPQFHSGALWESAVFGASPFVCLRAFHCSQSQGQRPIRAPAYLSPLPVPNLSKVYASETTAKVKIRRWGLPLVGMLSYFLLRGMWSPTRPLQPPHAAQNAVDNHAMDDKGASCLPLLLKPRCQFHSFALISRARSALDNDSRRDLNFDIAIDAVNDALCHAPRSAQVPLAEYGFPADDASAHALAKHSQRHGRYGHGHGRQR